METNDELVQYFLVNKDLDMRKGKIAAQVAHAATVYTVLYHDKDLFKRWYNDIQKKIILKADQKLLETLEADGYIAIRDKGYTQIPEDSLTVVTLGVATRGEVFSIVDGLSLL
jgi:peptidyl-tRNA hydrolase